MKRFFLYDKVIVTGFTVTVGLAALYPYHRVVTQQPPDAAIAALPAKEVAPAISSPKFCQTIPTSRLFARTELFFGLSQQDASEVSETEFKQFLSQEVTPHFPDGLTVLTAQGQFKNSSGLIIKESTKVLVLLYPFEQARNNNQKIQQIKKVYKTLFKQESVLQTDELSCVSF